MHTETWACTSHGNTGISYAMKKRIFLKVKSGFPRLGIEIKYFFFYMQ